MKPLAMNEVVRQKLISSDSEGKGEKGKGESGGPLPFDPLPLPLFPIFLVRIPFSGPTSFLLDSRAYAKRMAVGMTDMTFPNAPGKIRRRRRYDNALLQCELIGGVDFSRRR